LELPGISVLRITFGGSVLWLTQVASDNSAVFVPFVMTVVSDATPAELGLDIVRGVGAIFLRAGRESDNAVSAISSLMVIHGRTN